MKKYRICLCFCLLLCVLGITAQNKQEVNSQEKQEIIVYPNPAENTVHILGLENTTRASIIITDTYGSSLMQFRWEIKNNALSIPVPNLASGVYMLTITSKEQQIRTKFYKK